MRRCGRMLHKTFCRNLIAAFIFLSAAIIVPAQEELSVPSSSFITPEMLENPLTQRYIAQYTSGSGVKYLNDVCKRAALYLPFIKDEIEKRKLPPELAYLPVIESGFLITARSKSGAAGLWQFMLNSISPFNIRVTDYIDERQDFIKSTKGALQKLEDNYRTLGNWELALAAYNAGLGAVSRTVRRTKIRDYWTLSARNELKQETVHYVPKFIAAVFVLNNAEQFGIEYIQEPVEWTTIPLKRQVSLEILSQESGADMDILRRLNAELLYGITPLDSGYLLKIPVSHTEQINDVLQREDLNLIRYHYHVVRYGDTLWSMSRHYGAALHVIEQHNPGIGSRYLKLGETVIIPAFNDVPPLISEPARSVYTFDGQHIVVKGDTLWSLSIRYGVDPQSLAEANGMGLNSILREGRTLKVPILE